MTALTANFYAMCEANRDGSHATQAERIAILSLFADTLHKGGFKVRSMHGLKPRHVQYAVKQWLKQDLGAGTLKNRMSHIRWAAKKANKKGMIPQDNSALGIPDRKDQGTNKAQKLDMAKLAKVENEHMRMSMRMMAAFGLRREEALKIRPCMADKGDYIALKASWTKGGRERIVPVVTARQRALLDEAKQLAGEGSLIPRNKTYKKHRDSFCHYTLKAGFKNLHGLRHQYAQAKYKALTSWECPKAGGILRSDMSPDQRKTDHWARLQLSRELGHNRVEITKDYLG